MALQILSLQYEICLPIVVFINLNLNSAIFTSSVQFTSCAVLALPL